MPARPQAAVAASAAAAALAAEMAAAALAVTAMAETVAAASVVQEVASVAREVASRAAVEAADSVAVVASAIAAAVVVAHNHPSGDPSPSAEDLRITAEPVEAGRLLDIEMLDHLVIGRGRWTSLRAIGALGQSPATMR